MSSARTYLCGPINGCSDDEARAWREYAKGKLRTEVLDPMDRDCRDKDTQNVVRDDLADIFLADCLLVNRWKAGDGTPMEMVYGSLWGKYIVVVVPDIMRVSAWVKYHASDVVADIDTAITLIHARTKAV